MDEPSVLRFPNGDRKYPSHVELEKQGWTRGEYPNKNCERCGQICEWWGRAPIGSGGWKLFNFHSTTQHICGRNADLVPRVSSSLLDTLAKNRNGR